MKFAIPSEKLKKGMGLISEIPSKKLTLPTLENVLISAEKNFLNLESTNLETGIFWRALAKVEKPGKICIKKKLFGDLVSFLPLGKVEIEAENLIMSVKSEKIFTKLKGSNPEDFPIIPRPKQEEFIDLDPKVFSLCLKKLINLPSTSFDKPEISGILIEISPAEIKFAATDRYRLAEKKVFQKFGVLKPYSLILPQPAAKEIINIFSKEEKEIRVYLSPNQIFIEALMFEIPEPEIIFTSRLIEGEFPKYEEILPKKFETEAILNRDEFLKKLKPASLFSSKINEIKLDFLPGEKQIKILSENPDLGKFESEIGASIKGKAMSISFNYKYLMDGILSINEAKFSFALTSPEGPAMVKPLEAKDYYYLLMPIKTS